MELAQKTDRREAANDGDSLLRTSAVLASDGTEELSSSKLSGTVPTLPAYCVTVKNVKFVVAVMFSGTFMWMIIRILDLSAEVSKLSNEPAGLSFKQLSDGKVSFDVMADVIRFPKPKTFFISETTMDGLRKWSFPAFQIYVGDALVWDWSTSENIVSCDSNGVILSPSSVQEIYSGKLALGKGIYKHVFDKEGTFYYTSENSQSLRGKVTVLSQPSISAGSESLRGPIMMVPSGIQMQLTSQNLSSIEGCFQQCYISSINSFATPSGTTFLDNCNGEWIMFGIAQSTRIIGAFAKKTIFQRALNSGRYDSNPTIAGTLENKVYWYQYDDTMHSGYHAFGFSSSTPIQLVNEYHFTEYNGAYWSSHCMSSVSVSNNVAAFDCSYFSFGNGNIVVYSNTCPVNSPPY